MFIAPQLWGQSDTFHTFQGYSILPSNIRPLSFVFGGYNKDKPSITFKMEGNKAKIEIDSERVEQSSIAFLNYLQSSFEADTIMKLKSRIEVLETWVEISEQQLKRLDLAIREALPEQFSKKVFKKYIKLSKFHKK